MAKNEFDKLCLIGHSEQQRVKNRIVEYFATPSGSKRTQQADIEKARTYWIEWLEDQDEK